MLCELVILLQLLFERNIQKVNYENLLYYSYEDIEKQAKAFGFNFNSILEFEGYKFYCPEWTFEINEENYCYKIVCKSEYARMELTDTEIASLYEKTMLEILNQAFYNSKIFSDVYFIFMLFHLWQNYIHFTAMYDYKIFGSSQIKVGKTTLIWDNREKEFSVMKMGLFVKNKRYGMTRITDIVKSINSIMFSKEAKTGYRSRILNV